MTELIDSEIYCGNVPLKLRPAKAATQFSVSVAYLDHCEETDPSFPAPWRPEDKRIVLYDTAALMAYFTPSPRVFVPPVTGKGLPDTMVPDNLRSAKRRRRMASEASTTAPKQLAEVR